MSTKIRYTLFTVLLTAICFKSSAQDYQFSQFYANILYLNPAFAGSAHKNRVILHQRLQWPALDARYTTSVASYDRFFAKANSGVGVIVTRDVQGGTNLTSTDINLQYSYELPISNKYTFRAGLQGGFVSRNINYAALTFPDQFSVNGPTNTATQEPFGAEKKNYLDLSSGGVFYSEKLWVSLAYAHMNTPNQSFYGDNSPLPVKISVTGGYRFELNRHTFANALIDKRKNYLIPTFHYKSQGKSDQLDLGVYALFGDIMLGTWYRGIPIKNYSSNMINNESMVFLIGYKYKMLSAGYSYDFTVSKLTKAKTGGAHEFNLTILFGDPAPKKKKMRKIPCPDFD
ncbi:MAG: PorP/SprF family type IX secretion system membrane protein [Cytophaga sp.]|uniref:PorP/SprF family type IX secretion system membrane protein n=1 Tax=Cytophaga sp. TaxID=29535 RepID=UPI003F7CD40D